MTNLKTKQELMQKSEGFKQWIEAKEEVYLVKNLKKHRMRKMLSQTELARVLGVSNKQVSFWENGQSTPNLKNALAIAKVLGVTVEDLTREEE